MSDDLQKKKPLSRQRIVEAAIELVDSEGLDALSMRRLAGHLDAGTMSLYNHVPNKEALLDAMVEHILTDVAGDRSDDPLIRLRNVCLALRQAAHAHPEIFRIIAVRPPAAPSLLHTLEVELENLNDLGFDPSTTANALRILFGYVFGYIRLETGGFYSQLLRLKEDVPALDASAYPGMAAASAHLADWKPEVEFQQGLDAILAGLQKAPPVPSENSY